MKTFIKLLFLVVILLNFNVNSFAGVIENDCSKIKKVLGWKPTYTFETMMKEMTDHWMEVFSE